MFKEECEKIPRDYHEIYKPYISRAALIDLASKLDERLSDPSYRLTISDMWIVQIIKDIVGIPEEELPQRIQYKLDIDTRRPREVESRIEEVYDLLDQHADRRLVTEILDNLEQWDTEVVSLQSQAAFEYDD